MDTSIGFSSVSSGNNFAGYNHVNTFADLPDASLHANEYYIVDNATGIWLINKKEAGFYKSNGSAWNYIGSAVDMTSIKVGGTIIIASPIELAGNNITLTPDSENNKITVDASGLISKTPGIVSKSYSDSPYTVQSTDDIVKINATSGNVSVILPGSGSASILKTDSTSNIITLTVTESGTLNSLSSWELKAQGDSYTGRGYNGEWIG